MKKSKNLILSVLLAVCAFCLCFALVGCKGGDKDAGKYGYGEEGFYYYDGADSARYMLSLQSGTYMMTVNNMAAYSGSYSYDEESGKVSFKGDAEFAATLGDSALSLDMDGSGYSFKAYKFFEVTYVDETGKTVAVESVLNGQNAEAVEIEKDGYWFIGWYEGSDNAAEFAFDSAIAGDTTVYGWYIEKNLDAKEYAVTYDYGDGYTETASTQNGAVWKLPASYAGRAITGWWVSAVGSGDALTCRYGQGDPLTSDTTLFAVYGGLGASVEVDGITWDAESAGSSVSVTVTDENGDVVISEYSISSSSGLYTSAAFSELGTGTYTVEVASGSLKDTLTYVVNGLSRVSFSSADIVVSGSGRVLSFAPVEGADGYVITVTNGERTLTEDLGSHTYYNFSAWDMTRDGITFVVTAYAEGFVSSVSDAYTYLMVLDSVTVEVSDDVVYWNRVSGALEYEVTITGEGIEETFFTTDNSFSLKYYGAGTYDISVQPKTDGYFSEVSTYYGYGKLTLAAPEICDITNYSISWTDVGATSYVVIVAGTEIPVPEGTTLMLSEDQIPEGLDSYEISVKACAATGDSPYSDALVVTKGELKASLSYDRNTVYWSYDLAAAEYVVSVNGEKTYTVTEGNSIEIELTRSGENEISVTAYDVDGESLGYAVTSVYAYFVALSGEGAVTEKDFVYVAQGDSLRLGTAGKEHASFLGWYTQPDFTEGQSDEYEGIGSEVFDGSTFTGSRDMYLYAYWSYEYIDVTLVTEMGLLDGGSGAMVESLVVSVKYNSSTFTLPVPTPNNEEDVFAGWYTRTNGTGTRYTSASGSSVAAFEGETTLYAYYLAVLYYQRTTYNGQTVYSVSAGSTIDSVTEVTIPEKYTVNGVSYDIVLNSDAFYFCTNLVKIDIPDTVKYIAVTNDGYSLGTGAFSRCSNLEEVNIYETGDEVEPMYFSYEGVLFKKLDSSSEDAEILYYPYAKETSEYAVPSAVFNTYETDWQGSQIYHSVTTIPAQVFRDRQITKITIPASVTYIASQAFYDNLLLTEVVFAEGGEDKLTIENRAFRGCTAVTSVTLPARYADFNASAFTDCSSLTSVTVEADGNYKSTEDGVVLTSDGSTIVYYPTGRSGDVVISNIATGITTIGGYAFASNTKITSVTISSSVTTIGSYAFENCTGMTSLTFEGSAYTDLTIKSYAFSGCRSLRSLELPSNLTTMEANAFANCTSLITVSFDARENASSEDLSFANGSFGSTSYIITLKLGKNVPTISFLDIFGSDNLMSVEIEEGNKNYLSDSYGAVYDVSGETIIYYPAARAGDYELLESATKITSSVFAGHSGLTSIKIGKNVNTIESDAFLDCTALTAIIVDSENANYGNGTDADGNCDGILYAKDTTTGALTEVIYCSRENTIEEIVIPETVVKVADNAFRHNENIKSVEFKAESAEEFGTYVFYWCTSLETVILPGGLKSIPTYTFYYCGKLAYVSIPESVTYIGVSAFRECNVLIGDLTDSQNGIVLPEGLVTIEKNAFYNDYCIAVTIPSTVTSIADYAFYNCWQDSSVNAPIKFAESEEDTEEEDPALTIGQYAFSNAYYATSLTIPARVTEIGQQAFGSMGNKQTGETPIVFDEGSQITEIKSYTFYYAYNLKKIVIPSTVTTIGTQAFLSCTSLESVSFACEGETPAVMKIDQSVFQGTALTSVEIPATVTEIGGQAFYNIKTLNDVTFGDNSALTTVGYMAFDGTAIKEVEIPESVTSLGYMAFGACSSLESVSFEDENTETASGLTTIMYGTFWNCTSLTSVTLPSKLENLGTGGNDYDDGVFSTCTSLETVTVPASVKTIGYNAFTGCTKLASIVFGEGCSLKEIQDGAFNGCTSLASFEFPESTAESIKLGAKLFTNSGVKSITLSTSITDIGNAFQELVLESVVVAEGNTSYAVDEGDNPILYSLGAGSGEKNVTYVFGALSGAIKVPDGVVGIDASAYYKQTEITSVEIPASVDVVGEYAFYGCTALTDVVIAEGSSLAVLEQYAFSGCSSLARINLPDSVKSLPARCFENCDLSETVLPQSIVTLDTYALYGIKTKDIYLPNLESIGTYAFAASGVASAYLGDRLVTLSNYAFYNCKSLTDAKLSSSLTSIGQHAFNGCTSLAHLDIPSSVETIDAQSMQYCPFVTIELPARLSKIGDYAFRYCYELEKIEVPSGVTSMGTYVFRDCTSLVSAVLPDGLKEVGNYTFYGCTSLTSCVLPANAETLGTYVFYNCTSLESIVLPGTLNTIGNYCFTNTAIESVDFGDSLTKIGNYAFQGCTNLKAVVVGSKVTSLGTYVFQNCTSLQYAYTGDLVTTVDQYAFGGCSGLETVEFGVGLSTLGNYAFQNCTSLTTLVFDYGLTRINQHAFDGCTGLEYIVIPSSVSSVGAQAFASCTCDIFVDNTPDYVSVIWRSSSSTWDTGFSGKLYYYSATEPEFNEDETGYADTENAYWHYDKDGEIAKWEFEETV